MESVQGSAIVAAIERERVSSMLQRQTVLAVSLIVVFAGTAPAGDPPGKTVVSIRGDRFFLNGRPTYEGRTCTGSRLEGLLLNSRLVQGIFDDLNPDTAGLWAYPDTGRWDPERNTREFLAAMPEWRRHGLLCVVVNLQGGSPRGYSREQPWHNSAFEADGSLRKAYLDRLGRIIDRADALGMVVMLGYFYFGQDQRLKDEQAVRRAVDGATDWLLDRGAGNVLVEINNECDILYDHPVLRSEHVHELIDRVRARGRDGRHLLVGASMSGGRLPPSRLIRAADFVLLHGNGVGDPARLAPMVREVRQDPAYTPKPILFDEDDHFDFEKPRNNFTAALGAYASWGYFDYRLAGEPFAAGYQSVPVDWGINHPRKRAFFDLVRAVTGGEPGRGRPVATPSRR
jgi:hypothetical protein